MITENVPEAMPEPSDKVILLHGFASSSFFLELLRYRLCRFGFEAEHWGYPSLFGSIEMHAVKLRKHLERLDREGGPFHIVAHSMGSIITRVALDGAELKHLKRIVFLAPPNCGSPATKLAPPIVRRYCRPVVELGHADTSFVNTLECRPTVDVGVIAARYDMLVPAETTHLEGEADHTTLPVSHTSLLMSRRTARLVREFLLEGRFFSTE